MRNFIINLLIVLSSVFVFTGCKKYQPEFHKVKFEIEFYDVPPFGSSNALDVLCRPQYDDEPAVIHKEYTSPGYIWDYEYWQLVDGEEVKFIVNPQLYYHFTMRVYIDGTLISERELVTSTVTYYSTYTLYMNGPNEDSDTEYSVIRFTYHE